MQQHSKTFTYFICCVSAMGGLLFGYDWVVIGGAKIFYEQFFDITTNLTMQGLAMSIALAGCLIGALTAGATADRYGRKPMLLVSAVLFLSSAWATGAFDTIWPFMAARFWGGIAIGIASGLSPMYIAEVAPPDMRGRLVTLNQLTIVIGILVAQVVNYLLVSADMTWNIEMSWRWMFWAEAFPAAAFLVLICFIPESPMWLAMRGQKKEPTATLSELFAPRIRPLLWLGIFIAVFQQWCGTNVIFNYAQEVFQGAGYDVDNTFINIVVTGIANLVFTFVAIRTVDRWGRRSLMLIGAGGLAIIYALLGLCYYLQLSGIFMVILVVTAIACYAMSLGPVTWVLIAEIFPTRVRAVAVATATFALWMGSLSLTYSFPFLNAWLGTYGTFWIYAAICATGYVVFLRHLSETKGTKLAD